MIKGFEFQKVMYITHIKFIITSSYSTQATTIYEHIHQIVNYTVWTLLCYNFSKYINGTNDIIECTLTSTTHSMRANIYTVLKISPSALVFGHGIFFNLSLMTDDWLIIQQHMQKIWTIIYEYTPTIYMVSTCVEEGK